MIHIRTRPIKTSPPRPFSYGLKISTMRALLNSNHQNNSELFSYQEGQHQAISNKQKQEKSDNSKLSWPEEVKIIKTRNGKRWSTSSMSVELANDILEVRDGLDKVVDSMVLKPKT